MVAILETRHFVRFISKNVVAIAYWVAKHFYLKNLYKNLACNKVVLRLLW